MIHPPLLDYCGVTIMLSNPSRFDRDELVTGQAGTYLSQCLRPLSRYNCEIRTMDEIEPYILGTKVVILCGQSSLVKININKPLSMVRGSPYELNNIVYIPTYAPQDTVDKQNWESKLNAHLYQGEGDDDTSDEEDDDSGETKDLSKTSRSNYRFWFRADIRKGIEVAREGLKRNTCKYHIYPSSVQAVSALRRVNDGHLYIDIETDPETCIIKCIGFSWDEKEVWCVPVYRYDGTLAYGKEAYREIFRGLAYAFRHNTVVVHNAMFDLFVLLWKWGLPPPAYDKIYCTMLAQRRLFPSCEMSLGHSMSIHTHQQYHKDEGIFYTHSSQQDNQFWSYNCKDVEGLALVHKKQLSVAREMGCESSIRQGNSFIRTALTLQFRGIRTNTTTLCDRITLLEKTNEFFETRVMPRLVGYRLNPRSPKQVGEYLYDQLKLKQPNTGSASGKKTLYKLSIAHDIPALRLVLALRRNTTEVGKLRSRLWLGDRITGSYVVAGPKSFRLASRKMFSMRGRKDTGWGTNMQNWNKKGKRHIIADEGYELFQVDLSGVEAMIVAYLCPPGNFRALFDNKIKPHTYVAFRIFYDHWCELFGRRLDDLIAQPIRSLQSHKDWKQLKDAIAASDDDIPSKRFYYFAKQTCHSANYDIRSNKFVLNVLDKSEGEVVIPLKEGARYLEDYHGLFPEIRDGFHAFVRACAEHNMTLVNMLGYPRTFYGDSDDDELIREMYSWIPQSTGSACVTQIAMTQIQAKIERREQEPFFSLLQNGHDSIMGQALKGRGVEACKIIANHLNVELTNPFGEKFRLRSEAQVGNNWAGANKKNPDGLVTVEL